MNKSTRPALRPPQIKEFSPLSTEAVASSSASSPKAAKIQPLTGLRFVAALLVYISHLPVPAGLGLDFNFLGFQGVALFFALSGFVLTYNYYEAFSGNFWNRLWPFLVARLARIYPMQLFSFLWVASSFNLLRELQANPEAIVRQLTLTQAWAGYSEMGFGYNLVSWSVSVEFFFYLTFPILTYFVLRHCQNIWQLLSLAGVVYLGLLALTLWLGISSDINQPSSNQNLFYWLYMFPGTRLVDFLMGLVAGRVYLLWQSRPVSQSEGRIGLLLLYSSIGAIAAIILYKPDWLALEFFRLGNAACPFAALLIFCLARYPTAFSKLLASRLLVLLGEASYSFYLLHWFFLQEHLPQLKAQSAPGSYIYGLLLLLVLLLLSLGAYSFIEIPARKLLRRLLTPRSN